MAPGLRLTATDAWARRRRRAGRLRQDHPPAAGLLAFYEDLLALQEPIFVTAGRSRWLRAVRRSDGDAPAAPRLRLDRLPARPRARAFLTFVERLPASSTELLTAVAARLRAEPAAARRLLDTFLAGRAVDEVAGALACAAPPLEFFPRAFMQPVAEALVRRDAPDAVEAAAPPASCPHCGALPLTSVIRDLPEVKGRRTLCCSLCAAEWTFPRSCCPRCGEQRPDRLPHHATDAWPHLRVEECRSCRTYLKAVDLRSDGRAIPVVDELASVELDLWAAGQGMTKLRTNVLGL